MKLVEREAVRAILLSPEREVLLMRIRNPDTLREFWICPGGGMEPGESVAAALARELREELGIGNHAEGVPVHRRQHTFRWKDKRLCQRELFLLVRHERFSPVISDAVEAESLLEFRWWPLAELDSARHPITPLSLRAIVESFLKHGAPPGPLPLEVVPETT